MFIRQTCEGGSTTIVADAPTNRFSVGQNEIWDEIGDERAAYERRAFYGVVMPETLPASQDTNDLWGVETNGFQLSLRIPGREYVVGGTVPAVTVLRNLEPYPQTLIVTNSRSLFLSFKFYLGTNECFPKPENSKKPKKPMFVVADAQSELQPPVGYWELEWGARSERISELNLSRFFDSTQPGEYTVRAVCRVYSPTNQMPLYEISSGTASFRLLPKPPNGQK